jgi:hypothetical protein
MSISCKSWVSGLEVVVYSTISRGSSCRVVLFVKQVPLLRCVFQEERCLVSAVTSTPTMRPIFFEQETVVRNPHNILLELRPFTKDQRYIQTIKERNIISVQDLKNPVYLSLEQCTCNVAS